MKRVLQNLQKGTFLIDAIITIGFGFASWFSPHRTFGTILAIPETNESLILAILSSMSILYVLLGLVCVIGIKATYPLNLWLGGLMIIRHSWIGVMKIFDIGKEWLIGNPYPDILIHAIFFTLYLLGMYQTFKGWKNMSGN